MTIATLTTHKALLQRNVFAVVKDWQHSEELVNDTLLKAYNEIQEGRYNEQGKIEGWLLMIAQRKALTFIKRKNRNVLYGVAMLEDYSSIPDTDQINDDKNIEALYRLLYSTRYRYRKQYNVIMLHYIHGIPLKEIAATTGDNEDTVRSQKHHGLLNIKKHSKS